MTDFSVVFFFKQKTAYEMRISDWSSDVCSSDLNSVRRNLPRRRARFLAGARNDTLLVRLKQTIRYLEIWLVLIAILRQNSPGSEIGRASCRERVCQYV